MAFSSWTGTAAVTSHSQVWLGVPLPQAQQAPSLPHSVPICSRRAYLSFSPGRRNSLALLSGKLLQKPLDSKHPNVPWSLPRTSHPKTVS